MNPAQKQRKEELEAAILIVHQELQQMDKRTELMGYDPGMADWFESVTYAAYEDDLASMTEQLTGLMDCVQVGCEVEELDPGIYYCLRCGASWTDEVTP